MFGRKFVIFGGVLLGFFYPVFIDELKLSILFPSPPQGRRRDQTRDPELDQFGGESLHMITLRA